MAEKSWGRFETRPLVLCRLCKGSSNAPVPALGQLLGLSGLEVLKPEPVRKGPETRGQLGPQTPGCPTPTLPAGLGGQAPDAAFELMRFPFTVSISPRRTEKGSSPTQTRPPGPVWMADHSPGASPNPISREERETGAFWDDVLL